MAPLLSGQAAQDVLQDLAQSYHVSCLAVWEGCSPGEGFLQVPSEAWQVVGGGRGYGKSMYLDGH